MRSYRRQFEAVRDGAPQEQAGAAPVPVVMPPPESARHHPMPCVLRGERECPAARVGV